MKHPTGHMATEVACGWAGAVIKKANPTIWARAVKQKPPVYAEKANGDQPIDGPIDQPTNQISGL